MSISNSVAPDTLSSIGLALSGGGYRAAAFHLGALSYLDRIGLLSRLQAISTVSGGTFTGARYAASLVDRQSFADFFSDFYGDLARIDLVKLGLARLGDETTLVPSGRRDLIVAMAQVYAETFFKDKGGKPRLFGDILNVKTSLPEIVFNTTEFRHGIAFRFQKSARGKIGNGYVAVPPDEAAKIRVADIVAASSCFPGGFEPIAFPDDFVWPEGTIPADVDAVVRGGVHGPMGLMDGGIYDNQGVESLLLANERQGNKLDMFIISDVNQRVEDMYPFPRCGSQSGLTLGTLNLLARAVTILCLLTAIVVGYDAFDAVAKGEFAVWDVFHLVIPLGLAALAAGGVAWMRRSLRREMARVPQVGRAAWADLKRLRLGQVLDMVQLRISSLFAMASSVFMARIRSLVYGLTYRDERYQAKRVSNLIYDLCPDRRFFFDGDPEVPKPSPELLRVVEVAATMPTTLWIELDYQLPCLVASGEATMCYNLMKYTVRRWERDVTGQPEEIRALWTALLQDWKQMVVDPYVFLRPRLEGEPTAPPD